MEGKGKQIKGARGENIREREAEEIGPEKISKRFMNNGIVMTKSGDLAIVRAIKMII